MPVHGGGRLFAVDRAVVTVGKKRIRKFPIPVPRERPDAWETMALIVKRTRYSPGKKLLVRYLRGEQLTIGQAVKAMCHDCHGAEFGQVDCGQAHCPLYPWHMNRLNPE